MPVRQIAASLRAWVTDPCDPADHPWLTVPRRAKWCCTAFWLVVWAFCFVYSVIWAAGPAGVAAKCSSLEEAHPDGLDLWYGIMWWSKGDVLHPVINKDTGLGMGPSPYFDPAKPTLIYSHGYQPGAGAAAQRERLTSFRGVFMADEWLDQGWNVGSFYWTQFADAPTVGEAEDKIWPSCLPVSGICDAPTMSWIKKDGSSETPPANSIPSVSDLMYEAVVASTAGARPDQGFKLRIVGQSLGGSVVIGAGYRLAAAADAGLIPPYLKPGALFSVDRLIFVCLFVS